VLFGSKESLLAKAASLDCDLRPFAAKIRFVPRPGPGDNGSSAEVETLGAAAELLRDGEVTAVLAGAVATTASVIRAGISGVGLAPGVRTVSGAFIMYRPTPAGPAAPRLLLYADAGVVIAPTVNQLVDIASESAKTWQRIVTPITGEAPVLAFLSYATKGSATHETAARIAEAQALFKQRHPEVASDGEMQFDAAIDAEIGARKAPGSPVAGRANCCVFPDLAAGNIAYKITQRLGGYDAYGPILQGLNKPFSDLSRGSTVADIVMSACINLLRSTPATMA
jgi:phosphate acetyltransferase